VVANQSGHRLRIGRIYLRGHKAIIANRRDRTLRPGQVVVGDHKTIEERPTGSNSGERITHSPCTNKNYSHVTTSFLCNYVLPQIRPWVSLFVQDCGGR
jgi:hypothetical protein